MGQLQLLVMVVSGVRVRVGVICFVSKGNSWVCVNLGGCACS